MDVTDAQRAAIIAEHEAEKRCHLEESRARELQRRNERADARNYLATLTPPCPVCGSTMTTQKVTVDHDDENGAYWVSFACPGCQRTVRVEQEGPLPADATRCQHQPGRSWRDFASEGYYCSKCGQPIYVKTAY